MVHNLLLVLSFLLLSVVMVSGFGLGVRSMVRISHMKMSADVEETEDEQRERLRKKARKMMYNENGVAYAPWVSKQIDEDAIIDDLIRKEKGIEFKAAKTSILDRGEIEAAEGMRWRMQDNQVDLAWGTGEEADNQGFVVEKRPSYGGDFAEIASFREVSGLVSKGEQGGRYRYTDPSTAGGSWIYRVTDCDSKGKTNVLCQCFVEVQTETENQQQIVVAFAFAGLLVAASAVGYALNPPLDY